MKKLNKLQINSKNIMKNEELVSLRGGYGPGSTNCCCIGENGWPTICGTFPDEESCEDFCGEGHYWWF